MEKSPSILKESQNSLTFSPALAFTHVVNQINEGQFSSAIQHEVPSLMHPYYSAFGTVDEPSTCAFEAETFDLHACAPFLCRKHREGVQCGQRITHRYRRTSPDVSLTKRDDVQSSSNSTASRAFLLSTPRYA